MIEISHKKRFRNSYEILENFGDFSTRQIFKRSQLNRIESELHAKTVSLLIQGQRNYFKNQILVQQELSQLECQICDKKLGKYDSIQEVKCYRCEKVLCQLCMFDNGENNCCYDCR